MDQTTFPPIPVDTARAAHAVFGRSNFYLTAGDQANRLLNGLNFEDPSKQLLLAPESLARLYLITIFQYIETLPDSLTADALRGRRDWKYALHLPLDYPGLQNGLLCDFRRLLLVKPLYQQNLQTLLARISDISDFPKKGTGSLGATKVITAVCQFSRLAIIWNVLNQAMEALASREPAWLLSASLPHWYQRYGHHNKSLNLSITTQELSTLAQTIGADGTYLLKAVSDAPDPQLAKMSEVLELQHVWLEQFEWVEGKEIWRKDACAGCPRPAN